MYSTSSTSGNCNHQQLALQSFNALQKRNSVMLRSDQIRKERLFKIVECKDFALGNQQSRHPPPKYGFVDFSRLSQPPPFPPRPASVAKLGKVTKYRAEKSFSVGNLYHGK